jgi:hypothetical protein
MLSTSLSHHQRRLGRVNALRGLDWPGAAVQSIAQRRGGPPLNGRRHVYWHCLKQQAPIIRIYRNRPSTDRFGLRCTLFGLKAQRQLSPRPTLF